MSEEELAIEVEETPQVNPGKGLSIWGNPSMQTQKNVARSRQTVSMKHGMFASIPIICQGRACPYFDTCWIPEPDLQVGDRCPIEIATIMERFDAYCKELNINVEEETIDAGLVKDIVDIEIMMVRADGYLAKDAALIRDVVAGISPRGQEYYKPEEHTAIGMKERLRKEKTRMLNQLNATRKDKKLENIVANDPSSVAARIMAKAIELRQSGKLIDVTPKSIEPEQRGDQ